MRLLALCIGVLALLTVGAAPPSALATATGAVAAPDDAVPAGAVPHSCVFKGKKLWGKVQIVNSFPDFKVQKVTSFPDLKVQKVDSFPDKCGRWQFVTSFPDFKIQYVNSFPDFKIQMVQSFPGVP